MLLQFTIHTEFLTSMFVDTQHLKKTRRCRNGKALRILEDSCTFFSVISFAFVGMKVTGIKSAINGSKDKRFQSLHL